MKKAIALLLFLSPIIFAQHADMKMGPAEKPAALMSGLGSLHHPVSTTNIEAQRWFNQGLSLVFAFNHDEAIRSFKRAAELDPQMAMAWWGVALALGPNINMNVDAAREQAAVDAVQKPLVPAKDKPEIERAYIEALSRRYSMESQGRSKKARP